MTPDLFDLGLRFRADHDGHPVARTAGCPWPDLDRPTVTIAPTDQHGHIVVHGSHRTTTGPIASLCTLLQHVEPATTEPPADDKPNALRLFTTTHRFIADLAAVATATWSNTSTPAPLRWWAAQVGHWHTASLMADSGLVVPVLDRLSFRYVTPTATLPADATPLARWARAFAVTATGTIDRVNALAAHVLAGPTLTYSPTLPVIKTDSTSRPFPGRASLAHRARLLSRSETAAARFDATLATDPRWAARQQYAGYTLVGTVTAVIAPPPPATAKAQPSVDPFRVRVVAPGVVFTRLEPGDTVQLHFPHADRPDTEVAHRATIEDVAVDDQANTVTVTIRPSGHRPTIDTTHMSRPAATAARRATRQQLAIEVDRHLAHCGVPIRVTPAAPSNAVASATRSRQDINLRNPEWSLAAPAPTRRTTRIVPPAIIAAAAST